MSELIHMGTLLKRVEELELAQQEITGCHNEDLAQLNISVKKLEEKVKHLEEHYNFELRKDIENEENTNQMKLPLLTQTDKPCDCEDYPCCGHTAIKSPLQNW